MLETSSAKTAEAVTPFASPLLASIDRLVGQLASRIAGPQSQFSGRSLQFADRIFSRRLTTLGMSGAAPETLLAEREMEPQKWLLPNSWVPSAAMLRGGSRSASAPAPVADAARPAAMTVTAGAAAKPGSVVPPSATAAPLPPVSKPEPAATVSPAASGSDLSAAATTAAPAVATAAAASIDAAANAVPSPTRAAVLPGAAGRAGREPAMPQLTPVWPQELPAETPASVAATPKAAAAKAAPAVAASVGATPSRSAESAAREAASAPATTAAASEQAIPSLPAAESSQAAAAVGAELPLASAVAPAAPAVAAAELQPQVVSGPLGEAASVAGPATQTRGAVAAPTSAAAAEGKGPQAAVARQAAGPSAQGASYSTATTVIPAGETRVRDWLRPLLPKTIATGAAATSPVSAFARSLGHLGWSDQRLGQQSSPRLLTPEAGDSAFAEPESSLRAAAAPALPMVQAKDLTPQAPARSAKVTSQPMAVQTALPVQPRLETLPAQPQSAASPTADAVAASASPAAAAVAAAAAVPTAPPVITTSGGSPLSAQAPAAPTAEDRAQSGETAASAQAAEGVRRGPVSTKPVAAAVEAGREEVAAIKAIDGAVETGRGESVAPTADEGAGKIARHETSVPALGQVAGEVRDGEAAAAKSGARAEELGPGKAASSSPAFAPVLAQRGTAARQAAAPATMIPSAAAWRADGSLSSAAAALSPSLLASPVLRESRAAGSTATLIGLFAAGQLGRPGLPASAGLSAAARLPYRTPGALATHTEQLATAIGTHAAAGSAGVDNPFGGVQRWRFAPGLAGQVSRALDSDEPAGFLRQAQLSAARQLTFLPPPSKIAGKPQPGIAATLSAPAANMALGREQPLVDASPSRKAASAPESPAAPVATPQPRSPRAGEPPQSTELRLSSENQLRDAEPGRPWRLAGGMATLAELFAAGVGLGSGAAVHVARKAGVGPAASPMPPWLAKAAARTHFGLLGGPGPRRPPRPKAELDFVDLGESSETAPSPAPTSAPTVASAATATAAAAPLPVAATAAYASAPTAAAAPPVGSEPTLQAAEQQPFWQQAGGLAATAEAFARGHGIERAERQAPGGAAAAAAGRWVPVTGGMMFLSQESQRPGMTGSDPSFSPSAHASAQMPAAATERSGRGAAERAFGALTESAGSLGAWSQPMSRGDRTAADASVSEPGRTPVGAVTSGRGIDWGRAGGLGLRSELFAAGLGSTGLQARPLSAAGERSAWSLAPGVASPLAHALSTSEPQSVPRWTMSENGLLFVSGPAYPADGRAKTAAARRSDSRPAAQGAASSELASANAQARPRASGAEQAADYGLSALGERPWLQAGGTATLAELFSAGVGLGAGAVSGLAQQAGVAAGRSLLPGWLTRLLAAAEPAGDSDDSGIRAFGAALPFAAPAELKRLMARRSSGARPLPATAAEGTPSLSSARAAAQPGAAAGAQPLLPSALSSAYEQLAPFGVAPIAAERKPWPLTAGAAFSPAAMWQRAGGLGASAEAFARGRGIASTQDEAAASDDGSEAPAGRWLPVSGGMVFVPAERSAAARGKRAPATTQPGGQSVAPARGEPTAVASGRALDWPRVGGLGLRSELFTSGLGQPPAGSAAMSNDPLGGWAGAYQHLPSFQRQEADEEAPPRRFAWSGAGGLMYLAGASPSPRTQRKAAAAAARSFEPGPDALAPAAPVAAAPAGGLVPGGVAALAERFGAGLGSEPSAREIETGSAGSSALPLAPMFGRRSEAPSAAAAGSPISGLALPGRLSQAMLTGLPRSAAAESDESSAAPLRAALHSAERLTKLLSQLPAQWLPSAKVATAMQAGGVAESPIWQRLSPNLTRLAATVLRPEGGAAEDGSDDEASERHTHLTMVKGSSPGAPQKALRPVEPAWKQQTPQTMVSAALQKVAGSGTPMAAAAKMLESMRGQAGSASRADDRISLGDLTLIAISMGDNRMAAISRGSSPSPVPHVESALRQDDTQLVQPETEHTMNQKVDALAKMCLKYVEKHEKMMKERGSFDA